MLSVQTVKRELRIEGNADDGRLTDLITEAIAMLQLYRKDELTTLSALDKRFLYLYIQVQYDGRQDLVPAYQQLLKLIRAGQ